MTEHAETLQTKRYKKQIKYQIVVESGNVASEALLRTLKTDDEEPHAEKIFIQRCTLNTAHKCTIRLYYCVL